MTEARLDDEIGGPRILGVAKVVVGAIAIVLALPAIWRPFRRA